MAITPPVTLYKVCQALQADLANVSGIKGAPSNPTEQITNWPFVTTYPQGLDNLGIAPDPLYTAWWDIFVELHVLRQDLPADIALAVADFPQTVVGQIVKTIKDNHIACDKGITGTFGALSWGATQTLGWQFMIHRVKIQQAVPT